MSIIITWQKRNPSVQKVPSRQSNLDCKCFWWVCGMKENPKWPVAKWNWGVEADVPWSALCGGRDPFKVVGWFSGKWVQDYTTLFSDKHRVGPWKNGACVQDTLPETNIAPENWWTCETKSPSCWEGFILRGELVFFFKESRTFPLQLTFHFHDSRWGNAQKGTKIHQVAGNTCLVFFHVSIYVTYIILYIFSLYFTNTEILRTYIHIFVSMEM